jgi:hypothetical protein
VYYRQERYELAEYHFRKALSINCTSSILKCYIGMVLYANNRPQVRRVVIWWGGGNDHQCGTATGVPTLFSSPLDPLIKWCRRR